MNDYRCECFYGFTGINCEINIDDCGTNPCLNDGTCLDSLGGFKCACKSGYAGKDCSVDTNDCWSFPCYNNGTCVDKVNHYVCECPEGFVGSRCETNAIDCFEHVCLNGGICRDGINSYTCDCAPGFWGQHCEIEINECDSFPCLYGGSCHDKVRSCSLKQQCRNIIALFPDVIPRIKVGCKYLLRKITPPKLAGTKNSSNTSHLCLPSFVEWNIVNLFRVFTRERYSLDWFLIALNFEFGRKKRPKLMSVKTKERLPKLA